MESAVDLQALLHQLDDPDWLEFPRGYDRTRMAESFAAMVHDLNVTFDTHCIPETDNQDSSEYARVEVPAEATVRGTRIIVSISNFGSLALVAADNPGAFLGTAEAQAEGELDPGDLAKVEQVLVASGYVVVPEELLTSPYDGPSRLRPMSPSFPPTWWDRFFGSF